MPTVSVKNLGSEYRMGKTRLTAEVGSEPLAKAREILKREQVTLDDTLQEMLSHIVAQLQMRRTKRRALAGDG